MYALWLLRHLLSMSVIGAPITIPANITKRAFFNSIFGGFRVCSAEKDDGNRERRAGMLKTHDHLFIVARRIQAMFAHRQHNSHWLTSEGSLLGSSQSLEPYLFMCQKRPKDTVVGKKSERQHDRRRKVVQQKALKPANCPEAYWST